MATETKAAKCEWARAWDALRDHLKACHSCAMLWVGVGKDRYEYCAEYRRLEAIANATPCTCPD